MDGEDRLARFEAKPVANLHDQLLAEREQRRATYRPAAHIVGTCPDMCPEFERHERELHLDVSRFETLGGALMDSGAPRIDHQRAVKKYHRPAAGNEAPLPEDVRPIPVLQRTLEYLVDEVLDRNSHSVEALVEAQKFVRDRTRGIRQDLSVQHLRTAEAVQLNEWIARFHIAIDYRLAGRADKADYDSFQNTEQLRKVLITLLEMYNDGVGSPSEGEFRAYQVLAHLPTPDSINHRVVLTRDFVEVRAALKLCIAFHAGDYAGFFAQLRGMPPLMACLANQHTDRVRRHALRVVGKAYSSDLPLARVAEMVALSTAEQCREYLQRIGIEVDEHQTVLLKRDSVTSVEAVHFPLEFVQLPPSWRQIMGCQADLAALRAQEAARQADLERARLLQAEQARETERQQREEQGARKRALLRRLAAEYTDGMLAVVSISQAAETAKQTWLRHKRAVVTQREQDARLRIALGLYSEIEKMLLDDFLPKSTRRWYLAEAERVRVAKRQSRMDAMSERLCTGLLDETVLAESRDVAMCAAAREVREQASLKRALHAWSGLVKKAPRGSPSLPLHVARTCARAGHRTWNLLVLSDRAEDAMPLCATKGVCADSYEHAGCTVNISYATPSLDRLTSRVPPNAVLSFAPLPGRFPCPARAVRRMDRVSQYEGAVAELVAASAGWPPVVCGLDIVAHWHVKFVIAHEDGELPFHWQRIKEAVVELLTPDNPPFLDHPDAPAVDRDVVASVEQWRVGDVHDLESSFAFAESHALIVSVPEPKLRLVEHRLHAGGRKRRPAVDKDAFVDELRRERRRVEQLEAALLAANK